LYRSECDGQACTGIVPFLGVAEVTIKAAEPNSIAKTSKRRGRPNGYKPDACNQVVMLMSSGLSLTASAGVMGIGRTTIHRWMDAHEEFRDAISRGQAARTFKLETLLLQTKSPTVARLCRLALINAASEEWRRKSSSNTT
jgi:hypothetical protein